MVSSGLTKSVANTIDVCYNEAMHKTQQALLELITRQNLGAMSLRQIAGLLGGNDKAQTIKHHLLQLEKAGLIQLNFEEKVIKQTSRGFNRPTPQNAFYALPVVGAANCGPANIFAEERTEGYLKVSSKMLPRKKSELFVLVASGPSMNMAEVTSGKTIEDGDFVVVDSSYVDPKNGDIVVAVIDGMATIKRYREDRENGQIVLEAESTERFLPIFVHEGDDFVVSGRVIEVIKTLKQN